MAYVCAAQLVGGGGENSNARAFYNWPSDRALSHAQVRITYGANDRPETRDDLIYSRHETFASASRHPPPVLVPVLVLFRPVGRPLADVRAHKYRRPSRVLSCCFTYNLFGRDFRTLKDRGDGTSSRRSYFSRLFIFIFIFIYYFFSPTNTRFRSSSLAKPTIPNLRLKPFGRARSGLDVSPWKPAGATHRLKEIETRLRHASGIRRDAWPILNCE